MTDTPDPATLRRLAAECREDDALLEDAPWTARQEDDEIHQGWEIIAPRGWQILGDLGDGEAQTIARTRNNLPEVARALDAAAEMAERGDDYTPREMRLIAERDAALSRAEDAETKRDAARSEVDHLRAENKRLTALASVSPDDLAAVVAENDRLRKAFDELIGKLQDGAPVKSAFCRWCNQRWPHLDGESFESLRKYAADHAEQCPANEIRIERDHLRSTLAERDASIVQLTAQCDEYRRQVEQLRSDSERRIDALVQDVRQAQYERDRAQGASNSTALHRCARCNAYLTSSDDASAVDAALAAHRTICPDPSP